MTVTLEQRYLEGLRRLKKRTTINMEMAQWKEDLASRLWRAEVVLRATGEALYDVHAMEAEVKAYSEVVDKLKQNGLR